MSKSNKEIVGKSWARWRLQEEAVDKASSQAMAWGLAVVTGNICLMAALATHPFNEPRVQLAMGSAAILLHGWAAWEIGTGMRRWAKASGELAKQAADVLRTEAATFSASKVQGKRARGISNGS